jgi:tRNA(Ile)-lysidine synthase TilS/MesJ
MRNLVGSIIKFNNTFNAIKNNDKIAVGVSGGKDSTLLLYALKLYANYMKNKYG